MVLFTDDQISAIETDLWSIMTYSFFPKIGTAFIGQQAMRPETKSVTEISYSFACFLSSVSFGSSDQIAGIFFLFDSMMNVGNAA